MTIDNVVQRKVERVVEGGNLLANLALIDINTWQTSQEVFRDWQNGAKFEGVNTANLAVYRLENDEVIFELLGREGNPFMDEILRTEVYNSILQNEFFFPQNAMKQKIKEAKPLVTVRYSGLNIKTKDCSPNYGFIEADKNNTDEENSLFSAVYGTDALSDGKRVFLLRKNVVESQLIKRKDDLVVRACYFDNNQYFVAFDGGIYYYIGAVRGVRRVDVAEGDAKKGGMVPNEIVEPDYKQALDTLLGNPDKVLSLLNANPAARLSLLNLLTNSYNATKQ